MAARQPRIIDGTGELRSLPVAASQTWNKGTPVTVATGLVSILTDGDIPIGLAADDIATAQAANTHVNVLCFNKGTRIEAYTCATGSSSAVEDANLNNCYDWGINAGIGYIDLDGTTDKCVRIVALAADYEPSRNLAADDPGKVIAEIVKLAAT